MYKNISKSLLSVASLAMMSDARSVKVNEADLHRMNVTGETFMMTKEENLTIMMDYSPGCEHHWEL